MTVLIYHSRRRPETTPLPARWPAGLQERWLAELAPAKAAEIRALRCDGRRWESLVGLRLLARAMGTLGFADFDLAQVRFGRARRPTWDAPCGSSVDFSISHSHGLVACAVSRTTAVGLDVERVRPLAAGALELHLGSRPGARERALVPVQLGSSRQRLERWTRTESVVKAACGDGLARMRDVVCDERGARLDGRRWHTHRLALAPGFECSLATPDDGGPPPEIDVRPVAWSQLAASHRPRRVP